MFITIINVILNINQKPKLSNWILWKLLTPMVKGFKSLHTSFGVRFLESAFYCKPIDKRIIENSRMHVELSAVFSYVKSRVVHRG